MRSLWSQFLTRAVLAAMLVVGAGAARAQIPFQPPAEAKPKILRLLAYPEYFDPAVLEAFERATGYAVAYDAYALQLEIPDRWKQGPYDVVALPGPALTRRIAAGALMKLDKSRLPRARDVQPAVAAKLAAYDATSAYAVAFGWSPFGLIYDNKTVPPRLGPTLTSWNALLDQRFVHALGGCGAVIPNARDAVFVAAWRLLGLEPWKVNVGSLKFSAALLARVKPALQGFAVADPVGALARGASCLTLGTPGEAEAANARARKIGRDATLVFGYAREGGGVAIDAFAIPRDAQNVDVAYKFIDFLLRADNAAADARSAGIFSAEDARGVDALQRLSPIGAWDDRFDAALDSEWTHLRTAK